MFKYDVVRSLIVVNVIMFVLQMAVPNLTKLFLLSSVQVVQEPWRLLTHMFVHSPITLSHIFFNMFALFMFGPLLQRVVGKKQFLGLYLGTGLLAGIVSVLFHIMQGSIFAGLGASGAIMGMIGVTIILLPRLKLLLFFIIPMPLWAAGILWFILDTLGVFGYSFQGNVANIAHLAGMIAGLAYGVYLKKVKKVHVMIRQ